MFFLDPLNAYGLALVIVSALYLRAHFRRVGSQIVADLHYLLK